MGRETERQAKPPAEGLQRRRLLPDFRKAKASPSRQTWNAGGRAFSSKPPHRICNQLDLEGFGRLDKAAEADKAPAVDRPDGRDKADKPANGAKARKPAGQR